MFIYEQMKSWENYMTVVWIAIICAALIYIYNKSDFVDGAYKKQAISIIKSFIHLCHSCPKKMDKGFINNAEIALIGQINNKKNFEQWIENEVKKFQFVKNGMTDRINWTSEVPKPDKK